ncbi:MAG: hypothetical protein QNJ90_05330 [Planctomycetota bacterium]|nr:hypothetical protein [Planctomycetota bacterium]
MRTATMIVLTACIALAAPATAGDAEQKEIATLKSELARQSAEVTHLREAYNQLSATAAKSTRALEVMTQSLNAARAMISGLTTQRDDLKTERDALRAAIAQKPADDPARLRVALLDEQKARASDSRRYEAQLAKLGGNLEKAQAALALEQASRARDVTQLTERVFAETERANRMAIRATTAENELAVARAQLAKAKAELKALRSDRK